MLRRCSPSRSALLPVLALVMLPVTASAAVPARRAGDIGRALLPCWHPPGAGGEVTLALSLRRDGSVIGIPRVTYAKPAEDDGAALRDTVLDALRACTPIAMDPWFGSVVAGQVLRIRFVADPGSAPGRATVIWSGT